MGKPGSFRHHDTWKKFAMLLTMGTRDHGETGGKATQTEGEVETETQANNPPTKGVRYQRKVIRDDSFPFRRRRKYDIAVVLSST